MDDERWENWVARGLKGERLHEPPPEVVDRALGLAPRPAAARRSSLRWVLAAAASLIVVVAAGWLFRVAGPPELPGREPGTVVRGARIEALSPTGEIDAAPRSLRWSAHAGAERYRVRLFAVDDSVLWAQTTAAESIELPDDVSARLLAAVAYQWQVEALDESGGVLAASERVQFRLAP